MRFMRVEGGVAVNAEEWDAQPDSEGALYVQSDVAHIGATYDPQTHTLTNPAPLVVVPQIVSRMQLKRALNQMGLLGSIETAISQSADTDLKIYWAETSEFHRDHPKLNAALTALGFSPAQADQAFTLAATLS